MAERNIQPCLTFVFQEEGGYTDDPLDPGGATNLGITLDELSAWRHTAVTKNDVRDLQRPEATAIYMANYWNAIRASDLPAGVDLVVFDAAVNTGISRGVKMLQIIVNTDVDGHMGPMTIAAIASMSASDVIERYTASRVDFYQSLPTFNHFGAGWLGRTNRAEVLALQLAQG